MKKSITDKNKQETPELSSKTPVNVFIGFEDPETEVLLKKEYLGMKEFKIVMEDSYSFLGKKQKASSSLIKSPTNGKSQLNLTKVNNSAQKIVNKPGTEEFNIDKKLLKSIEVRSLKDNIKKKDPTLKNSKIKEEPKDLIVKDELEMLFEGPIKKKEDIVVKLKLEVNLS